MTTTDFVGVAGDYQASFDIESIVRKTITEIDCNPVAIDSFM